MSNELGRAAVGLGVGAAASVLLGLGARQPWRLVTIGGIGILVILALAALAVAGGRLRQRGLVLLAGLGFLAAAALQLVQATLGGTNTLGGDGSTIGLLLGFGVGLITVGLTQRASRADVSR